MQHHVFLSYSRRDTDVMHRVRDSLRASELIVWTDETLIPGTSAWQDAIEAAIENAGCMVIILSPDAKSSKWVKRELTYAETHDVLTIPILAEGTQRTAIPFSLIDNQFADIRDDYDIGIYQVINAIRIYLKMPKKYDPALDSTSPLEVAPIIESHISPKALADQDWDNLRTRESLALALVPLTKESGVEGILLLTDTEIIADVGTLNESDKQQVLNFIKDSAYNAPEVRVTFITSSESGKDYLLYTRQLQNERFLSLVFAGSTSLKVIRKFGSRVQEALQTIS